MTGTGIGPCISRPERRRRRIRVAVNPDFHAARRPLPDDVTQRQERRTGLKTADVRVSRAFRFAPSSQRFSPCRDQVSRCCVSSETSERCNPRQCPAMTQIELARFLQRAQAECLADVAAPASASRKGSYAPGARPARSTRRRMAEGEPSSIAIRMAAIGTGDRHDRTLP